MSSYYNESYLKDLVDQLRKLPKESEWVEFKTEEDRPERIGAYISALANMAALLSKEYGYLVWGISDKDHEVVGTSFDPDVAKKGNEELESWLVRSLNPIIHIRFYKVSLGDHRIVILKIPCAFRYPVSFQKEKYIRIGSYLKKSCDFPDKEREIWESFSRKNLPDYLAVEHVDDSEVIELMDCEAYYQLILGLSATGVADRVLLEKLEGDRLIKKNEAGYWDITGLGALLFARDLRRMGTLERKALRVIQYQGKGKEEGKREYLSPRGYAAGFDEFMKIVDAWLPSREILEGPRQQTLRDFPPPIIRELIANALIHQNVFIRGSGPMVEIFEGRVEITNPGAPLVEIDRIIDAAPRTRNESLAGLMRRTDICEERGSGWDKIIAQIESHQLPPPSVQVSGDNTRVVLYAPRPLSKLSSSEKCQAIYFHACLKHTRGEFVTNASVRQRFGIHQRNSAQASRLIASAVREGALIPDNTETAKKLKRYLPWWALESQAMQPPKRWFVT